MAITFETVASDARLSRVLGAHDKGCSIEIWVLQLNWNDTTDVRVLYGRILPSSYCNTQWSAPKHSALEEIDSGLKAQVTKLSIYCTARTTKALLEHLGNGNAIARASEMLGLSIGPNAKQFERVSLQGPFAFRPVMHLVARDYCAQRGGGRLSPTFYASVDSAAITVLQKAELLKVVKNQAEPQLARYAIQRLDEETGLSFGSTDAWRIGDIEVMVFPALDDEERCLYRLDR